MKYFVLILIPLFMHINYEIIYAHELKENFTDFSLDSLLNIQVSTASKYQQTAKEAAASVAIITSEDIERYGYKTLQDVFISTRGFNNPQSKNTSDSNANTDTNDRVLLLIDGHTMNENVSGSFFLDHAAGIDLDMIDRIEIVRGPGSTLYGTNAMFVVANIITKRGDAVDGLKFSAETGNYGRLIGSLAYGKEYNNGINILISGLAGKIEEEESNSNNTALTSNFSNKINQENFWSLSSTSSFKEFKLHFLHSTREKDISNGMNATFDNNQSAKTNDIRNFMEFEYEKNLSASTNILFRTYYDRYKNNNTNPYYREGIFLGFQNDNSFGKWFGGELRYRWDIRENNRLITGMEYRDHFRSDYLFGEADSVHFEKQFSYHDFSFYTLDDFQVTNRFSLSFGIRIVNYSLWGTTTTPRAAIIYHLAENTTFKLLYGEAFRAPNVIEAYYEMRNEAKPNPKIEPEKIKTTEIVWEQRYTSSLFSTISISNYDVVNLIEQIVDPSDSLTQYRNTQKVKATGLQFEINARFSNGLHGYLNYNYKNDKNFDFWEKITNSPNHITKLGISSPFFNRFYGAFEARYDADQFKFFDSQAEYNLICDINVTTKQIFNHFKLSLRVENLYNISNSTTNMDSPYSQTNNSSEGRIFIIKLKYKL